MTRRILKILGWVTHLALVSCTTHRAMIAEYPNGIKTQGLEVTYAYIELQRGIGALKEQSLASIVLGAQTAKLQTLQLEVRVQPITKLAWDIQRGMPLTHPSWHTHFGNTYLEQKKQRVAWRLGRLIAADWNDRKKVPRQIAYKKYQDAQVHRISMPVLWGAQLFWMQQDDASRNILLSLWSGHGYLDLERRALYFQGDPWNRFSMVPILWSSRQDDSLGGSRKKTRCQKRIQSPVAFSQFGIAYRWQQEPFLLRLIWDVQRDAVRSATLGQPRWVDLERRPIAEIFSGLLLQADYTYGARRFLDKRDRAKKNRREMRAQASWELHAYDTEIWSFASHCTFDHQRLGTHRWVAQKTHQGHQYAMRRRLATWNTKLLRTTRYPWEMSYRSNYPLLRPLRGQSVLYLQVGKRNSERKARLFQALSLGPRRREYARLFGEYGFFNATGTQSYARLGIFYADLQPIRLKLQVTRANKPCSTTTIAGRASSGMQGAILHWHQHVTINYRLGHMQTLRKHHQFLIGWSGQFILFISGQMTIQLKYRTMLWSDQGFFRQSGLFFAAQYAT